MGLFHSVAVDIPPPADMRTTRTCRYPQGIAPVSRGTVEVLDEARRLFAIQREK
jgi:hypothetical protein